MTHRKARSSVRFIRNLLAVACATAAPAAHAGTSMVDVALTPAAGVTGTQRVSFAVPLAPGQLLDGDLVRVLSGGAELPAARRELAYHPDGSVRRCGRACPPCRSAVGAAYYLK